MTEAKIIVACNRTYDDSVTLIIPDGSIFDGCVFDDCVIVGNPSGITVTNCKFNGRAADWYRETFP